MTEKLNNEFWNQYTQFRIVYNSMQIPPVTDESPTSEKWWEGPGLISGGAAHPIRLVF